MHTAVIKASAVELALIARRIRRVDANNKTRWAAMSARRVGYLDCRPHRPGEPRGVFYQADSMAGPMERGFVLRAIERTARAAGTRALPRIFSGAGLRALRAEPQHILRDV